MINKPEQTNESFEYHEASPSLSFPAKLAIGIAFAQTFLLALGLPNLLSGSGVTYNLKIVVITFGASLVSFGILHLAIEYGAYYAARKFKLALIVCVIGIIVSGIAFGSATFTGNTLEDTALRQVQAHGTELSHQTSELNEVATQANRAGSSLNLIESDLIQWAECERTENCLSNAKSTGVGSITRVLRGLAGKAFAVKQQFEKGEIIRVEALETINAQLENYQEVIGDESVSVWERRNKLKLIDNLISQTAASLKESVPLHLVAQYAKELRNGINIQGRPDVAARINKILSEHGKELENLLESLEETNVERIAFPEKPGVDKALSHALTYLPIFLIVVAIDGIIPLFLFLLAYTNEVRIVENFHRERQRKLAASNSTRKGNCDDAGVRS